MKLKEMNAALQWFREKYAVQADGVLAASAEGSIGAAAELKMNDGTLVKLLPWRIERRFVELEPEFFVCLPYGYRNRIA